MACLAADTKRTGDSGAAAAAPATGTDRLRLLTRTAMIAGLYAALTVLLAPISYGPLQVRVAEALTVLPFVSPAAVPGLFLGCVVANLWGGLGWQDVVFGSLATLLAALTTRWLGQTHRPAFLAPLPPVVFNALIVPAYLHVLFALPYWLTAGQVLLGQVVACYALGYPLLLLLLRGGLAQRWR
ncbi:MAG: QueT transporter family protein [Bacillota bacterium]|nr:QueT transporter family protein [Bacillota bacterium]